MNTKWLAALAILQVMLILTIVILGILVVRNLGNLDNKVGTAQISVEEAHTIIFAYLIDEAWNIKSSSERQRWVEWLTQGLDERLDASRYRSSSVVTIGPGSKIEENYSQYNWGWWRVQARTETVIPVNEEAFNFLALIRSLS